MKYIFPFASVFIAKVAIKNAVMLRLSTAQTPHATHAPRDAGLTRLVLLHG
jgi:hypothetical protein